MRVSAQDGVRAVCKIEDTHLHHEAGPNKGRIDQVPDEGTNDSKAQVRVDEVKYHSEALTHKMAAEQHLDYVGLENDDLHDCEPRGEREQE